MKQRIFFDKVNVVLTGVLSILLLLGSSEALAGPSIKEVKKKVQSLVREARGSVPHVTAKEFKKIMDSGRKYVLIDVRTKAEYDAGHLPGAIHIPRGLLEWVAPKKIKDTNIPIYVYCRTGARSAFAAKRLRDMGYGNVTNIHDSFKGWVSAGFPIYNRHGEFVLTEHGFEKKESTK